MGATLEGEVTTMTFCVQTGDILVPKSGHEPPLRVLSWSVHY